MSFDDVQFPTDISYESGGGPGFSTSIIVSDSGREVRSSRWSSAKRFFDVRYGIKSPSQLAQVRTFYIARRGAARGFRFQDPTDYTSAADGLSDPGDDQEIGTGDGTKTVFALKKNYVSGPVTVKRTITKPVVGTVKVYLDNVEQMSGWTLNDTNGRVTFTTAPALGVIVSAGFEYDVPARFGKAADDALFAVIRDFKVHEIGSIPVVEDPNPDEVDDDLYAGGAKSHGTANEDVSISRLEGRVHTFSPTADIKVNLQPLSQIPTGAIVFWLNNDGSADLDIREITDTNDVGEAISFASLVQMTPGKRGIFSVGLDDDGQKSWYWVIQ